MSENFPTLPFSFCIDGDDDTLASKRLEAFSTNSGFFTAAVLIETLSAPALSSFRISSKRLTPLLP